MKIADRPGGYTRILKTGNRLGDNAEMCFKMCIRDRVCSKIRSFRKPEPYTGKGIKFVGEEIRRKSGKSAGAK